MRLAVIADVHGNAHALEAVLADIDAASPDLTVNLGDCLSGPFDAGRAADVLMARDMPTVSGNHDRMLVEARAGAGGRWEHWAMPRLSDAQLDWIASLPPTQSIEGDIFLCHGTPDSDVTGWLDTFNANFEMVAVSADAVGRKAESVSAGLMLCGHTHFARVAALEGDRLVVNPGSVGCPGFRVAGDVARTWSAGSPHARYALLDKTRDGWAVSFRAIPYEFHAAAEIAVATGSPEMASAVATGWVA